MGSKSQKYKHGKNDTGGVNTIYVPSLPPSSFPLQRQEYRHTRSQPIVQQASTSSPPSHKTLGTSKRMPGNKNPRWKPREYQEMRPLCESQKNKRKGNQEHRKQLKLLQKYPETKIYGLFKRTHDGTMGCNCRRYKLQELLTCQC